MKVSTVSILICTYNRARLLRQTLSALREMTIPPDCDMEVVVVDNNSTDHTPAVVAEAAERQASRVRPLRETRQGKSFALNLGLAHAGGDVVALTDDDVLPARDWLSRIVEAFRTREITFAFGKVLPRWGRRPPPELLLDRAQDIWGPLAIVDYGNSATDYLPESQGQRLPIGANLSFSRNALLTAGGWRTDLGKVNNSLVSGEDHEIFARLRRLELYRGHYDPLMIVRHYVPPQRLTREYLRRWFFWHGKTQAMMLADLYPELDLSRVPRILGTPRFAWRQGLEQFGRWLRTLGRHDALANLVEEVHLIQYLGLFRQCWARQQPRAE